jgi:hypothetical protein
MFVYKGASFSRWVDVKPKLLLAKSNCHNSVKDWTWIPGRDYSIKGPSAPVQWSLPSTSSKIIRLMVSVCIFNFVNFTVWYQIIMVYIVIFDHSVPNFYVFQTFSVFINGFFKHLNMLEWNEWFKRIIVNFGNTAFFFITDRKHVVHRLFRLRKVI